ncbi:MAG: hypothetical protein KF861_13020 [Planctomycetaceae bacterium]|nr:hypothetical protein [Planctomycetaceae bacterium]
MSDSPDGLIREPMGLYGWVHDAFSFVWVWFFTRSLWMFLRGLPALIVLVAIPVLALSSRTTAMQESRKRNYLRAAINAAEQKDFAAAELWNRKLISIDSADQEAQFRLALAIEEGGDVERGREILARLTPRDVAGFLPAHRYLAAREFSNLESSTPESLRTAVWHATKALDQAPDDLALRELMVRLQIRRGGLLEAAFHLSRMVTKRPELHLMLAGVYQQLNMNDAATVQVSQARMHFQSLRAKNPDELQPLLWLVETHAFTHDFDTAEVMLVEHLNKQLDVDATKLALLKLALVEIDANLKKEHPDWGRLIALLERSLGAFPNQEVLFPRVAIVAGRLQGPEADQLRKTLEDALADGRAPAVCHLLLGTMLGKSGRIEDAVQHLRAAQQVFPENPVVLNNLACFLMELNPPRLDEALQVAQLAVTKAPHVPDIRETRGQILAKLGRPEEALPDLEAALNMHKVPRELHETLAVVYGQLGDAGMSARHRQRAAEMAK